MQALSLLLFSVAAKSIHFSFYEHKPSIPQMLTLCVSVLNSSLFSAIENGISVILASFKEAYMQKLLLMEH